MSEEIIRAIVLGIGGLWYFDGGGIILSRKAQRAYADLQEQLTKVILCKPQLRSDRVTDSRYDQLRGRCSQLRTEMARDLNSRRRIGILVFKSD